VNRAQRRWLRRKAPHLLHDSAPDHVCQAGAHVLFHPVWGYLVSSDEGGIKFAQEDLARATAQRFHQECAIHFAAHIKATHSMDFSVRHQEEAEAEGWK
jgi:hypothetical protein